MLLIVDDNHDSREVLVRLAGMEGYEAVGVRSGTEALLFLRTHKPSLVVLEYAMPVPHEEPPAPKLRRCEGP